MNQAHIYLHGVIGSYIDSSGKEVKGIELLDVIRQVKAQAEAKAYLVHCKGPGGIVDTGDQIYDYLKSLKATATVDTITDGDVGSILTKIFLVGQERTIVEGHEFFIHNPWTQPQAGDSNQISAELQALKQAEINLRSFYIQETGITDEGLKGLMDNQTGMNADTAVTLGFATKKIAAPAAVKALFALDKSKIEMSKENGLTFGQKIAQIIDLALGNKSQVKALTLEVEGGKKVAVTSEDPAKLEGASVFLTDEAGNPTEQAAPDGEHKLADGRVLVVSGGKVSEVKPKATQEPAPDGEMAKRLAALEKSIADMKAANPTVNIDEKLNAAITQLKNDLVSGQRPPKAINNGGGAGKVELSPVQLAMRKEQQK